MSDTAWLLIVVYFAGMSAVLVADMESRGHWHTDELLALLGWPLMLVVGVPFAWMKRKRSTCPICKRRWHDRAAMQRHRVNCDGSERASEGLAFRSYGRGEDA